jgi:hypothetical protein
MARSGQSHGNAASGKTTQRRSGSRKAPHRRSRPGDDVGLIPVLARAVR